MEKGIEVGGIITLFGDVVYDLKDKVFRIENCEYLGYKKK